MLYLDFISTPLLCRRNDPVKKFIIRATLNEVAKKLRISKRCKQFLSCKKCFNTGSVLCSIPFESSFGEYTEKELNKVDIRSNVISEMDLLKDYKKKQKIQNIETPLPANQLTIFCSYNAKRMESIDYIHNKGTP